MENMEWLVFMLTIFYIIITFPLWLITTLSFLMSLRPNRKLTKEEWKMGGRKHYDVG